MARPGTRIQPVTLYAEKDEVEDAFKKMTRSWICLTCRKEFSLLESMGALTCHQHPGFLQEDGRWSCCGQKQVPARWSQNWPVQRMFSSMPQGSSCNPHPQFQMPYQPCPKVRGCQPCDHNTSDAVFTHKDAMQISDLSALLPFLNKEFPFHLRQGFDEGVLRRCAKRKIVVPPNAAKVVYMDNSGEKQVYTIEEDGPLVPSGLEICAEDDAGNSIQIWH